MSLTYSPKIATDGLLMCLDASNNKSYPTDLPVKNGLVMWMDAADDTTFSYSSGTTVSQWRDKSGSNYHMTPVSAGPTRNAFLNSRKVLAFTTSQDIQNLSIDLRTLPYTVFIVSRYTSPSAGTGRILTSNAGYNNWLLGHWASETNKYYANGWVYSTYVALDTNWKMYLGDWGGPSNDLANFYGAGTAIATNSADASAGPWTLGINANSGERSNCEAAEIIVFNRVLSAVERRLVHTYLGQKWGISNTDRSIVDLSGNNKIISLGGDLGSQVVADMPTFDYYNKGTFFFDGSTDTILTNIPITATPALSNFTYEMWTKLTNFPTVASANIYGVTTRAGFLMGASAYGGAGLLWYGNASGTGCVIYGFIRGADAYRSTSAYSLALNQYYHLVLVNNYGADKLQLFVNGSLYNEVSTATAEYDAGSAAGAGNIGIAKAQVDGGGTQNYTKYAGSVPLARIYNKALSAAEVLQNYEAQKSKFVNTIVQQGLVLNLDAGNPYSYAGAGTTWYDTSGNGNNGTFGASTAAPTYNSDNGGSLLFDGSNDYASVSYNSVLNTPNGATYSIWIYPTQSGEFLNRGTSDSGATPDNPRLYIDVSNKIVYFDWSNVSLDRFVQTSTSFDSNSWIQITATVTVGGRMEVYINGVVCTYSSRLNADTMPNPLPNTNDPIQIGGATWIPRYFGGRISIVSLYNIALSAAQVLQNYNATKGRFGL